MRDFSHLPSKLDIFQKELQKRLLSQSSSSSAFATPKLLQKLSEIDDDLLEFTLGDFGKNLKYFIKTIDFNHPDVTNIFQCIVSVDSQLSTDCLELLLLGKFAKSKKLQPEDLAKLAEHLHRRDAKTTAERARGLVEGRRRSTHQGDAIVSYEEQRAILIQYLQVMIARCDWHGVADVAMDLREMEAEQRGAK
jgi:hypothetical protein